MITMIKSQKSHFEARILKMKQLVGKNVLFERFLKDYDNACKFYEAAITGIGKSVAGEDERMADKYANVLLSANYLDGKAVLPSSAYNGMQKLNVLYQLRDYIEMVRAM